MEVSSSLTSLAQDGVDCWGWWAPGGAGGAAVSLETRSSPINSVDGSDGGDGGGAAAGSAAVEVEATDAGVLHLGVGVERAVAAKAIRLMSSKVGTSLFTGGGGDGVVLAAVAVAASALAAEEQVQASPKRRCSKRVDSVWVCSWVTGR